MRYSPRDFEGIKEKTIIMTAKDAIKCRDFAEPHWWYLDVYVDLPEQFNQKFLEKINQLREEKSST